MPDFLARRCCTDGCKSIIVGTNVCEFSSQTDYRPVLNGEVLGESPFVRGELDGLAREKGWAQVNNVAWHCSKCVRRMISQAMADIEREHAEMN